MILGIDTSCYTTSFGLVDMNGDLIKEQRNLLKVSQGERGLQQSAALFQHIQNIPLLFSELSHQIDMSKIKGVCASTRPRPVEGSYMPVFTVSQGLGQVIASTKQIPFFPTSHQEGHIMAGLWSAGGPCANEFLAAHLSGGTSEVLKVTKHGTGFHTEILGATTDLHAGQFIDRIGVELGTGFPAGPVLEKLALECDAEIPYLTTAVKNYEFSFSGPETAARKLINEGVAKSVVARAVEHCIATTLEKVLRQALEEFRLKDILIVGGVAANKYIRKRLSQRLEHRAVGAMLYFAKPKYSTDNAVGVAQLGLLMYNKM